MPNKYNFSKKLNTFIAEAWKNMSSTYNEEKYSTKAEHKASQVENKRYICFELHAKKIIIHIPNAKDSQNENHWNSQ